MRSYLKRPARFFAAGLGLLLALSWPGGQPAKAAQANAPTAWMLNARYGLFVHYQYRILLGYSLNGLQPPEGLASAESPAGWNAFVDGFDVNGFADQMVQGKVGWVNFCIDDAPRGWQCTPNATFDTYTGYAAGNRCSNRDLIWDLAGALHARGIKLICYWAGLVGWSYDSQSFIGMAGDPNNPNAAPSTEARKRRLAVLKEYCDRYGTRIDGWWFDGMGPGLYDGTSYNYASIDSIVRTPNPGAVIAFSWGSNEQGDLAPGVQDFAGGDTWSKLDLTQFMPKTLPGDSRILWDGKMYCGNIYHGQGTANQYTDQELITWLNTCGSQGGVCTMDWPMIPQSGLLKDFGAAQLDRVAAAVWGTPLPPTGPTPYLPSPVALPGTIEAENFDMGGEGVAYHTGTTNQGGAYRPSDGVSIEACSDTGGGFDVGWTASGDWMGYTVSVAAAGSYDITARVSSGTTGGSFHIEGGPVGHIGSPILATVSVPGTGGWQTWTNVTVHGVALSAGTQWFRIVEDTAGYNINWISVSPASGPLPPTVTSPPANQSVTAGQTAAFSVTASGAAPLSYQWQIQAPGATTWTNVGGNSPSYTIPATTSADNGTSVRVIVSNGVLPDATSPVALLTVTSPGSGLPPPWADQDIGATGLPGSASVSGGAFTLNGSGVDIWGTADGFHFVFQTLNGDGEIIAQVSGLGNTDPWAKAGVMIRETLTADSTQAMMVITPGNGTSFERRTSTGGASTATAGPAATVPYWVRLVRSGTIFSAYASSDGAAWTLVGTDTIAMATNVYIGLVVTSHNNAVLNTATLDSVQGSGGWQPPASSGTGVPSPASSGGGGSGGSCGALGAEVLLVLALTRLRRRSL
jgi:hypothetical protein